MPSPNVLLIHGIWNHRSWLQPLAAKLRSEGFAPTIFAYDSIMKGPEAALPALLETIDRLSPVGLIGHSLGGVMALEALRSVPGRKVDRVVCLGSPLKGSFTARHLAQHPALCYTLGRSVGLLTRGMERWEGETEVGVVAGTVPRGLGRWVAPLQGPNDGTVLVSETELPGLTAHCLVACGHTELAFSKESAQQAARFLRTGAFQ